MRRIEVLTFAIVLAIAGCGPRPSATLPSTNAAPKFPANFTRPAAPPAFVPPDPSTVAHSAPVRNFNNPAFFNGEAALGNGVYYLAFSNGNIFGYYSYLPDPHYIYHFDAGYFYVQDAANNVGVYLYDFSSRTWWYTATNFTFPYIYNFGTNSVNLYYADTNAAGHYTTHPRFFYDFGPHQITIIPQESPDWVMNDASGSISMTPTGGSASLGPANGVSITSTWGSNDATSAFSMPIGLITDATHTTPGGFPPMALQGIHTVGYFKISAYPARTFSATPSFAFTVGAPSTFGGTTCDIYNLKYSQNGTPTWAVFGIPSAQVSGSTATFPSIAVPQGQSLQITSTGYGGPGYIALGCH